MKAQLEALRKSALEKIAAAESRADLEALRYMISTNCVTKEGYYLDIQNSLLINMVYLSERLYKLRSTKIKIYSYYNLKSTVEIQ